MEGVAALKGAPAGEHCCPTIFKFCSLGPGKNQNLEGVTLLNSLQSLTFVGKFNQSWHGVMLPNSLKLLKFGVKFPPEL